jgi:hypothetical protein
MSPIKHSRRRLPRRSRQSGVLLGVVLILIAILFAAGLFALWSMRGDTGSAGRDRLQRQLFDCAEQGLAWGKQYFTVTVGQTNIDSFLAANVCSTNISTSPPISHLPCTTDTPAGPFPTSGSAVAGYPNASPFTQNIIMDNRNGINSVADFQFTVGVYNDPGDSGGSTHDANQKVIIYSRCTDLNTLQQRSVQALISIITTPPNDYTGQAGRGFRNQGNQNF